MRTKRTNPSGGCIVAEQQDKPLWRKLQRISAEGSICGGTSGKQIAAQLRTVADEVLPEEPEPPSSPHMGHFVNNALWKRSMDIRRRLFA